MEHISILVAFSAGILSSLSPCVLPLVPVYLTSLAGPEVLQPKMRRGRLSVFLHSLSFVAGFSIVFITLGVGASLVGFAISPKLARELAGSLLIALGLFMVAALKLPWLNYEKRFTPSLGTSTGYLRSLIIGAIFALAWTPCVGPVLGGILTLAISSDTVWHGAYLLSFYSLGLGIPFLIIGAAFDFITPWLKRVNRYSRAFYMLGSLLLIVIGILILTNNLSWFNI